MQSANYRIERMVKKMEKEKYIFSSKTTYEECCTRAKEYEDKYKNIMNKEFNKYAW